MDNKKLLSIFDILDQLYENSYQISKCCYSNNECLLINYLNASKFYKFLNNKEFLYKDLYVLYNTLYGDYMSTIINQIDKAFEKSCNDLSFFHITKLNDIIDNYKLFNNE